MFNFFKIVPVNKNIKPKSKVVSYCNNSTFKVFCYVDEVQIFCRDWECITLQIKNLKLCCIPENSDYIILLSQNLLKNKVYLNIYNISNQFGRKIATLISNSIIESSANVTALSALYVWESQMLLSIGLENGYVLFYKSALQKEIPANSYKYFNVSTKPIKGIKFIQNKENINMFVCSDGGTFCYTISNKLRLSETKLVLDDMEYSIHCISLKPSFETAGEQYLVIARDNGLYCYTAEGRGPCYAINGHKEIVEWFGKMLIIVLKNKPRAHFHQNLSQVLIYDVDNKIIVLNKELHEVTCLLPTPGHSNCLILLKNGEILTLKEKDLRYKLSQFIKKRMYDIALKLLEEHKTSRDISSDILFKYGDYLLQCGDTPGAVNAYAKTIGSIPPFLIIKKLMDFRYNESLVKYLSALVKTEFKLPEHLDLLNNCFRRINLPKSALRVFEIEDIKEIYVDETINHSENVTLHMNNLRKKQSFPPNFFDKYSNTEIIQFLLEYGYYLFKEFPNGMKELTKFALSDQFLKNNVFNRILIPLSLMNKQCALHFVDAFGNCEENTVFNIITEIILQMWSNGYIDTNFVIDFFKSSQSDICIDNIFVLCRHYKFWPGIKMMYDKCNMEMFSAHCLVQCFELFPEYVNIYPQEYSNKNLNQMIQTLRKEHFHTNNTLKYVSDIVKNMINSNPYYILRILNNFVSCSDILFSQLDEFVVQEKILPYFKCDDLLNTVSFLDNRVIEMEKVLHNYLRRPIEFRNRSCDICKQAMKQPSVFFLCQHSFHKQCLIQFSEVFMCIICTDIEKSNVKTNFTLSNGNVIHRNNDTDYTIIVEISKKMGKMPFNCEGKDLKKTIQKSIQFNDYKNFQTNPFENQPILKSFTPSEYDDNLNPFSN